MCAVGVDDDGVGDVLHDAGPASGSEVQRAMALVRAAGRVLRAGAGCSAERIVGEEPECVFGFGIVGGMAFLVPVDGREDDEVMGAVEVDPKQAARRAEVDDAAGDGDIAVAVGEDFAGDGEVVERGVGERAVAAVDGIAPEGLRGGEELLEERNGSADPG